MCILQSNTGSLKTKTRFQAACILAQHHDITLLYFLIVSHANANSIHAIVSHQPN